MPFYLNGFHPIIQVPGCSSQRPGLFEFPTLEKKHFNSSFADLILNNFFNYILFFLLCSLPFAAFAQQPSSSIPEGLFSPNAIVRLEAVKTVERDKLLKALPKLSTMAQKDKSPDVRKEACRILGILGDTSHVKVLKYISVNDLDQSVAKEAQLAIEKITGIKQTEKESVTADNYKEPQLMKNISDPQNRLFAVAIGTMGGYGLAAFNIRFKIDTKAQAMPFVGIELGGGWTPPVMYPVISGYTKPVVDDDSIRWKLWSGAAAVLFYLHRNHYIPLRGGFDIGQGPYGQIGYGYEHHNMEGIFSWGIQVGIHAHSMGTKWAKKVLSKEDAAAIKMWPVVPYVRFVLHFYLV
jgi:hypothetical protein